MRKIILSLIIILFGITPAFSQFEPAPGFHTHDGFYLSLCMGAGYLSMTDNITNAQYKKMEMKGNGTTMDIKIGGAIRPNFILHGDLISSASYEGDIYLDSRKVGKLSSDETFGTSIIGVGFTYYIMPQNTFICATVGSGNFSIISQNDSYTSDNGFAFMAKVGKEWWVSTNWGLGVSVGFNYVNTTTKDSGVTEDMSGSTLTVMFNTTFN